MDFIESNTYVPEEREPQEGEQKQSLASDFDELKKNLAATTLGAKAFSFWGKAVKQTQELSTQALKHSADLSQKAQAELKHLQEQKALQDAQKVGTNAFGYLKGGWEKANDVTWKDLEGVEGKAEEYLKGLGTLLKDAVMIQPPDEGSSTPGSQEDAIFDAAEGDDVKKKQIHVTRLDRQLHALHTTESSFKEDPSDDGFSTWRQKFDAEAKTEDIAKTLDQWPELRAVMDRLVPEEVTYAVFWTRYFWHADKIRAEEQKRKELLQGAGKTEDDGEEFAWDEEDEEDESANPASPKNAPSASSTETLDAKAALPEPSESETARSSTEQTESSGSYDVVSAGSATPQVPEKNEKATDKADDESDDDWE